MPIPAALLEAYQRTVVTIGLTGARVLTITPTTVPAEGSGRHVEVGRGPFLLTHARRVDVLTAANPGGRAVADDVNRARNERLRVMLRQRGVHEGDILPAVGRAPRGFDPWEEPSVALLDVAAALVVIHARLFDQLGWYRWDRRGWRLVITAEPDHEVDIAAVGRLTSASERAR